MKALVEILNDVAKIYGWHFDNFLGYRVYGLTSGLKFQDSQILFYTRSMSKKLMKALEDESIVEDWYFEPVVTLETDDDDYDTSECYLQFSVDIVESKFEEFKLLWETADAE